MALFIRQNEDKSKLQERLNAQLQERHKTQQFENKPETVEDSNYMKDMSSASSLSWLWVLLGVGAVVIAAYFIYTLTA